MIHKPDFSLISNTDTINGVCGGGGNLVARDVSFTLNS